jgi:diaminopimelate epimerase
LIHFAKAHACGNDFLIVEQDQVPEAEWANLARQLCARNTGIGADGVEYFRWTGELKGSIRLFNADGSIAEISGNGTRCVAAWMADQCGAVAGAVLRIETDAGWRECRIVTAGRGRYEIASGMGTPAIRTSTVSLLDRRKISGTVVDTGNPHFVIFVNGPDFVVDGRSWQSIGEEICFHPDFPSQTNVEFVRVRNLDEIEIRIFERGVGPTNSSGTGTCATASASIALHGCHSPLRVIAPGGAQQIEWQGSGSELLLTGPAILIAHGEADMQGDNERS